MKKNKNQKEAYSANTEYTPGQLELQGLETVKTRKIIVRNDGKTNSSDAGLRLLQQVEQKHRIIERLSKCFTDNLPWVGNMITLDKHKRPKNLRRTLMKRGASSYSANKIINNMGIWATSKTNAMHKAYPNRYFIKDLGQYVY